MPDEASQGMQRSHTVLSCPATIPRLTLISTLSVTFRTMTRERVSMSQGLQNAGRVDEPSRTCSKALLTFDKFGQKKPASPTEIHCTRFSLQGKLPQRVQT